MILAILVILIMVTGLLWWQASSATSRLREETLSQAQRRAAQVASAVAEMVNILLLGADATSREVVDLCLPRPLKDMEACMRQAIEHLPPSSVLQVAVIGADGYLAYSNLGSGERTFLGDREHFRVHAEGEGDALFISRPVLGRVSRQWSVQFSRAIRRNGRFEGVLVLSISPAYVHDALARVTLESADTLTVLRTSGEYLARNVAQEAALGQKADPSWPSLRPGAAAQGSFNGVSRIDGAERIFHWQRLAAYPIVVQVGLSRAAVIGPVDRVVEETRFNALVSTGLLWLVTLAVVGLVRRMRTQARRREEAEFIAMHDSLTGLHSRHALMAHMATVLAAAAARGGRVGILYMDLDGFKPVNDRHGHAVGDQVLQAVAGRLKGCVRGSDFPARIGGDEFVVVMEDLADDASLAHLAGRIHQALEAPMAVGELSIRIGASIGLAVYPDHGADADALLVHADHEMYAHKARVKAASLAKVITGTPAT
ncbi:diguanylate cyclase domain-containing protein [Ramlibacter sp. MAHUQ-53]|uniref:diguanylate cyclase domain-containing protein n=1 Tax=unclassified Ramlibacter TaxID=2617605 RepID=UPI00362C16ED